MQFVKVEGAGNDYVLIDVFDRTVTNPGDLARRLSDRHLGVGADGLLLVGPGTGRAHASMRIFNADGSEGRMCGNGLRCVVQYLAQSGHVSGPDILVETASGLRSTRLVSHDAVEVEVGPIDYRPEAVPARLQGDGSKPPRHPVPAGLGSDPEGAFAVSVGNPHLVVRVADAAAVDLARYGPDLATSSLMPEGANVHVVTLTGRARLQARTWERGSGPTQACGTGAVAIAAVARSLEWVQADRVQVDMPGGRLDVRWDPRGGAWLSGSSRRVFEGEWPEA